MIQIIPAMVCVAGTASGRAYVAPMVFGMISEMTSTSSVSTADVAPTQALPKTTIDWAPTPAAPTVWAMVLSVRMAASGRSIVCLNRRRRRPARFPVRAITSASETVSVSRTASHSEHRNDTPIARTR